MIVLYFANPSTSQARAAMEAGLLGMIATPVQGNVLMDGVPWCADNGCFGNGYPGDEGLLAWLATRADAAGRCAFAVAPDVPPHAAATLLRSAPMLPRIRAAGYRVAQTAQNGLCYLRSRGWGAWDIARGRFLEVPWDQFDVLFLGGSAECPGAACGYVKPLLKECREIASCPLCGRQLREWKIGPVARALVAEARRRGKWVHMGRVNTRQRLRAADEMGCDSADGTCITVAPDITLPQLLGWMREVNNQGVLWEAS